MVMWRVGEDDTKGRARPLPTVMHMLRCPEFLLRLIWSIWI